LPDRNFDDLMAGGPVNHDLQPRGRQMGDDQTRILQEILDVLKEQTAVTNKYRDEAITLNRTMLGRQRRTLRIVLAFMAALIGFLVYVVNK
jgi:hypothetical protein